MLRFHDEHTLASRKDIIVIACVEMSFSRLVIVHIWWDVSVGLIAFPFRED